MPVDNGPRPLENRPRRQERQVRALRHEATGQRSTHTGDGLGDTVALAGTVRDDAARRVRRG